MALSNVIGLRLFGPEARQSVFDRLRVMLAGVFLIGGALALVAAFLFSRTAANEAYDRLLISAALQMAETVAVGETGVTANPPDAAFETLAQAKNDRVFYVVRDPRGRVITGTPNRPGLATSPELNRPRIGDDEVGGAPVRTATVGRYVTTPAGGGWASVVVAQTHLARNTLVWSLMLKIAALVIFVSALGFFAALAAARRALLPLSRIEQALAAREANDVTPLEVESPRETQALVDAINLVMARFDDRMSRLQTFVGIAAHQLRTPIAALMAQVELLDGDRAAAARHARIERLRERLIELGRLTNQLLGHAMVIYRAGTITPTVVDLSDIARKALNDGVPRALDRNLTLAFDAPDPVMILGDEVTLREGLTNLVNNAALHGARARLEVGVTHENGEAVVWIFDDGPGIGPDDWAAALKPFTSPRGARAGAGLGLAIAQEIAVAHGGQLEPRRGPDGFEIRMRLPAVEAP